MSKDAKVLLGILGVALLGVTFSAGFFYMQSQDYQQQNASLNGKLQAQSSISPVNNSDPDSLFSSIENNVDDQMHKTVMKCRDAAASIPSNAKIKWCQQKVQDKLDQLGENQSVAYDYQMANCKDDACRKQWEGIKTVREQYNLREREKLRQEMQECASLANDLLMQKCDELNNQYSHHFRSYINI